MLDLVQTFTQLQGWGVDFISLHEQIDTTTATGKLVFHVSAAFAEFERSLISERQKASVQARRGKEGRRFGRLPVRVGRQIAVKHLCALGWTYRQVKEKLEKIGLATVAKYGATAGRLDVLTPVQVDHLVAEKTLDRADAFWMLKAMPETPAVAPSFEEELSGGRRRTRS